MNLKEINNRINGIKNNREQWTKVDFIEGYECYYHESTPDKKPIVSADRLEDGLEKPQKIVDFIVAKEGEIVGFSEAQIISETEATMNMQKNFVHLHFPIGIEDSNDLTVKQNTAICVDDNYRNKGIGQKMLLEMLNYLRSNNISRLSVHNIKDYSKDFYKKTGAEFINDNEAKYDIENAITLLKIGTKTKEVLSNEI